MYWQKEGGPYGYAGLWCDCDKLIDTLYYRDYGFMIELFGKDGLLKDEDVKTYHYDGGYILGKNIGIAYKDTSLYKTLSSKNDFNPIPNAYLGVSTLQYEYEQKLELIEKTFIDSTGTCHKVSVWTLDCDDAYIIELEFGDGVDFLLLDML